MIKEIKNLNSSIINFDYINKFDQLKSNIAVTVYCDNFILESKQTFLDFW
jgi:hypothetical protein